MAKEHFKTLDGLRGVAAVAVLVGHASEVFLEHSLVPRKLLAVVFFFLLSGFVIAYAYEEKLRRGLGLRDFLIRRAIRLYPLVFLGATFAFGQFLLYNLSVDHARFGSSALHELARGGYYYGLAAASVPCLTCGQEALYFPANPPGWSLFYELIAYAVFGLVCFRLRSSYLGLLAVCLLIGATYATVQFGEAPFHWRAAHALGGFLLGVLLYRFRTRYRFIVPGANLTTLGATLLAFCVAPVAWGPAISVVAIWLAFPLLIVAGSGPRTSDQHLADALGELSYPLYIVHWPVLMVVWQASRGMDRRWSMVAACVAAVIVAEGARRLFDIPLRKQLNEALRQWERRRVSPATRSEEPIFKAGPVAASGG